MSKISEVTNNIKIIIFLTMFSGNVIAEPLGTVVVSEVKGHTGRSNSQAQFWVSLSKQPTADVTIGVRSDNTEEGIPNVEELVFTTENWRYRQAVDVIGQYRENGGFSQNYHIELLPAVSLDANFSGVDADDVHMRGLVLEASSSQSTIWLTPDFKAQHSIDVYYTGGAFSNLRFELLNAPVWMDVGRDGFLYFQPPYGAPGTSSEFCVRVTDTRRPQLVSEIDLRVNVAPTRQLTTQIIEDELRVTDTSSTLNDMRFVFESDSAAGRELNLISPEHVPPVPSQVKRLSDIFYSDQLNEGKIEIRVPLSLIDNDADIGRLVMFHRVIGRGAVGWLSGLTTREVRTIDGVDYAILKSRSLYGEQFIGLEPVY